MTGPETATRPHVIKDAKGKRPQFYSDPGLDHAMSMILVLANELNVLRDRVDAQERVAKAKGVDLAAEIEALQLDTEALEERETWRQDFLDRLFYLSRKEATEAKGEETREGFEKTIAEIAVD